MLHMYIEHIFDTHLLADTSFLGFFFHSGSEKIYSKIITRIFCNFQAVVMLVCVQYCVPGFFQGENAAKHGASRSRRMSTLA